MNLYDLPREVRDAIKTVFPVYRSDADARCFACRGRLENFGPTSFPPGRGARGGRCARCSMSTHYDLAEREAAPTRLAETLPATVAGKRGKTAYRCAAGHTHAELAGALGCDLNGGAS